MQVPGPTMVREQLAAPAAPTPAADDAFDRSLERAGAARREQRPVRRDGEDARDEADQDRSDRAVTRGALHAALTALEHRAVPAPHASGTPGVDGEAALADGPVTASASPDVIAAAASPDVVAAAPSPDVVAAPASPDVVAAPASPDVVAVDAPQEVTTDATDVVTVSAAGAAIPMPTPTTADTVDPSSGDQSRTEVDGVGEGAVTTARTTSPTTGHVGPDAVATAPTSADVGPDAAVVGQQATASGRGTPPEHTGVPTLPEQASATAALATSAPGAVAEDVDRPVRAVDAGVTAAARAADVQPQPTVPAPVIPDTRSAVADTASLAGRIAARVEAAVEALRNAPPPREAMIDVDGLRVTLRLIGDTVHVGIDRALPPGSARELGQALAGRGLQLADGSAQQGSGRGRQGARDESTAAPAPGRPERVLAGRGLGARSGDEVLL